MKGDEEERKGEANFSRADNLDLGEAPGEKAEMIAQWRSIIRDICGRDLPGLRIETKRGGWTAAYYPVEDVIKFRPDVWRKLTLDEKRLTVLHELFHYFEVPQKVDLRHYEFDPIVDIVLRKLGYPYPEEYRKKAEKIIEILQGVRGETSGVPSSNPGDNLGAWFVPAVLVSVFVALPLGWWAFTSTFPPPET